jgi:nickel-type superoxide dismutase maturation protease
VRILGFNRVVISGDSMSPTYNDGDWLLVKWLEPDQIKQIPLGRVVVVERMDRPGILMVKRLQKSHGELYWVEGDNPQSTDSRQWGWIGESEIVGVVKFRIKAQPNQKSN